NLVELRIPKDVQADVNTTQLSNCSSKSDATIVYDWKSYTGEESEEIAIPTDLLNLGNCEIRSRLLALGDFPGPVTDGTRNIYLKRLTKVMTSP
ncbi:hypothetical protein, partial [Acinetobacter baumannii]|uniref:hypothetical protein n=1 Tax=Acinetobacter baumannii TaxID=470 RepID=UPI0011787E51